MSEKVKTGVTQTAVDSQYYRNLSIYRNLSYYDLMHTKFVWWLCTSEKLIDNGPEIYAMSKKLFGNSTFFVAMQKILIFT
jgi:hypothetical protein